MLPTSTIMPPSNRSSHNTIRSGSSCIETRTGKQSVNGHFNTKDLDEMQHALPVSTDAERRRFLADRNGNAKAAINKLRNYLEWRKRHCDDDLRHLDSWTYATQLAVQSASKGINVSANNDTRTLKLPCTLFMLEQEQSTPVTNSDGEAIIVKKKYMQHLPAQIDTKLAGTSIYTLAFALYLDHALDRSSTEKVTLIIDVRSGHGWANIKAIHLLPFIQSAVRLLSDLFPMRLEQCIIFPVPYVANVIWKAVKPFLGEETAKKVCLISGPAGRNDKVPKKMNEYLDKELIIMFEERRNGCFST